MKLWLLKRLAGNVHEYVQSMVVRAVDKETARQIASAASGSEGPWVWKDERQSSCTRVWAGRGEQEVICKDTK